MRPFIFPFLLLFVILPTKLNAQYKVMFSNNYPPYNYIDDKGKLVGFNIDLLNAVNKLYESEIHISGGEWQAINQALDHGEVHAIGGAHYPGSPDNNYIYTRSTISTSHCFLFNTDFISNFSLEYLRSVKEPLVVLWQNDILIRYVLSINPSTRFLHVTNYYDLVNALDNKDVTCAFGQRVGSIYTAQNLNKNYIRPLEHRILERNMGFKISGKSPELAKLLNNGLEVVLANGEYQRIYDKWITAYNKDFNDWRNYLKHVLISGILIIVLLLLLLTANRILKARVRKQTKDLRQQLELNSQIMTELEKQKVRAEESDKMKSAFLANMSHEIRTPMNGILGFANLLESADYSPEEQAKFINIIQRSGERMLETINNIIDVSKLESGQETLQIKEVNIKKMMDELLNFFSTEASAKGLEFSLTENSSGLVKQFYTDEYKLNSILTNLIKNALKFTREGSVKVKYKIREAMAEFWVTDTGIGIAEDKQTIVFDHFVQADLSHSSGFEGSGLGLSISKGYVKLLNGIIHLESELNKGTTFYVRIPNNLKHEQKNSDKSDAKVASEPVSSKLKIIVAEDDETSFTYLEHALQDVATNIIHAKNGTEVIEITKQHKDADVILMDIKMPGLNGFEATKAIREFNSEIFIIAQTAYVQENYKTEATEAGCNAYISKPVNKQKLFELLSRLNKNQ